MRTNRRAQRGLAVGAATLAGFVDALGFIQTGGVFVSFMSGNSTRFAVGITDIAPSLLVLIPVVMILCFLGGVMGGRLLRHYAPGGPPPPFWPA